jgi:hypothetical protein
MHSPFRSAAAKRLLSYLEQVFSTKSVFQRPDRHLIFVCGGPQGPRKRSARAYFLRYARTNLHRYHFLVAEHAWKELTSSQEPAFRNIAEFETLIAKIADCIIIFPESVGSYAELGYFSNSDASKHILVVNNLDHHNYDSFLNIGPIDLIDGKSDFRKTIPIPNTPGKSPDFSPIRERLANRLSTQHGKRLHLKEFSEMEPKHQFYLLHKILYIFRVIPESAISIVLEQIFDATPETEHLHWLISS